MRLPIRILKCIVASVPFLLFNTAGPRFSGSYYVSCALRFLEILRKLDIPFVCELYTEVASKKFEVTPGHHGISDRISENITFDPAMNQLEDFDAVPHLEKFINIHPIRTLERMATADALIMSRSSFSYVAAILNANGIMICYPFWHAAMKDWLLSDEQGTLPETDLTERLTSWKRAADRDAVTQPF